MPPCLYAALTILGLESMGKEETKMLRVSINASAFPAFHKQCDSGYVHRTDYHDMMLNCIDRVILEACN
jgi:hypothetical protein